jgi:hypothetical protein
MSAAELEDKYGYCRGSAVPSGTKGMTIKNTGSVAYEEMNSCGYHPQYDNVFCDVEVKLPYGFGPHPSGTMEYVLFCLDCDANGTWDFQALGSVHVTNDISGGPLPFYFNASASTLSAHPLCTGNDGINFKVRAILSWQAMPTSCTYTPVWGNQITFDARRDP